MAPQFTSLCHCGSLFNEKYEIDNYLKVFRKFRLAIKYKHIENNSELWYNMLPEVLLSEG